MVDLTQKKKKNLIANTFFLVIYISESLNHPSRTYKKYKYMSNVFKLKDQFSLAKYVPAFTKNILYRKLLAGEDVKVHVSHKHKEIIVCTQY